MIRAKELRNGILIEDYTGQIREVSGEDIQQQCWYEGGQTGTLEAPLNPIPLTPEWLERCGFNPLIGATIDSNRYFIQVGNDLYLNYYTRSGSWCVEPEAWTNEQTCWLQPKYLHQLQNLYFALTGEELNVKL